MKAAETALVVIANRPDRAFFDYVRELEAGGFAGIEVVDNATEPEFREQFRLLALVPRVHVSGRFTRNRRKALEAGIDQAFYQFPAARQAISADPALHLNPDQILQEESAAVARPEPSPPLMFDRSHVWIWLLLLVPLCLGIKVVHTAGLLDSHIWNPAGQHRFEAFSVCMAVLSAAFWFLAPRWFVPAAVVLAIALSAFAVGPLPVATVLLFVFCLTVLGRIVFGRDQDGPLAFLGGMALWVAAMYAVNSLPVHYPGVYLAALLAPVAVARGTSLSLAKRWLSIFRAGPTLSAPAWTALAACIFALTANWLIVLKPEISTDGLAMHLAIPASMALHHRFVFDFHEFIWALMPLGGDYCYAVVYSLGGEFAARLLNFALLIALALMVFGTARRFISIGTACLLTALFVSSPMIYMVSGSMFVENFVAAMVLGSVLAVSRLWEKPSARNLMLAALLLGTAMAMKTGAIPAALIGLCLCLLQVRNISGPRRGMVLAPAVLLIVLGLGFTPYAKAWVLSGNPLFPFSNRLFFSPIVGNDIMDERFTQKPDWRTPINMTFRTSRYFEGQNGSLGFQYFLLWPLTIGALFALRRAGKRSPEQFLVLNAVAVGSISGLLVALAQPNVRYLYFTFPLLTIGMAGLFGWLKTRDNTIRLAASAVAVAALAGNLVMLPTADWYHRNFYSSPLFTAAGRAQYIQDEAPIRNVIGFLNNRSDGTAVMFADGADMSDIKQPAFENHWHDYPFLVKIRESGKALEVLAVMRSRGVGHVVADTEHKDRQETLTTVLRSCGSEEFKSAGYVSLKIRPDCEAILSNLNPFPFGKCEPGPVMPAGTSDERVPAIRYLGPWTHEGKYPKTYGKTISYSNAPEARACVSFEGTGIEYVYSRAPDRGKAQIQIDGNAPQVFDLYDKAIHWQSKLRIQGLVPGRHELTLRVLPEKNPASSDFFVDFDALTVF